ncbi:MAG: formylglycine-generating enzyme family protein, partial [Bacteroidales bacterium]|nr:formylglycine-generating enzyme family protein [Bacteroidales bacterium]
MKTLKHIIITAFLLLCSVSLWATNVQITKGPEIVSRDIAHDTITVRFSLSWDNSWNLASPPNHDAVWVFMKYRALGHHGFKHSNLHQVDDVVKGAGSTPYKQQYGESQVPNSHDVTTGLFLYRSNRSVGTTTFNDVELKWNIAETGIDVSTILSVRVYAIEMVYVPVGSFATPNTVVFNAAPVTFPNGTAPFYMMKHEVTQAAWVDFINSLDYQQQLRISPVAPSSGVNTAYRTETSRLNIKIKTPAVGNTPAVYGVSVNGTNWDHETNGGNIPMFGLAWTDITAYLDWACLRPLTELEYEKAARGELPVVANEFVWGDASVGTVLVSFNDANLPNEVAGDPAARISIPSTAAITAHTAASRQQWPVRVGAFARENTTRLQAGASYWGILNMTDNVAERYVCLSTTAGNAVTTMSANGRLFNGIYHGDGNILGSGLSNVTTWPEQTAAIGATNLNGSGYKGIGLNTINNIPAWAAATFGVGARVATMISNPWNVRDPWTGVRGGRTVEVGFEIFKHPSTAVVAKTMNGSSGGSASTAFPALSVTGLGGLPPYTYQWYETTDPEMEGTAIEGATAVSYIPPFATAHTEKYFYCVTTDSEGAELTSNVSGAHTVMNVGVQPSTEAFTTSITGDMIPTLKVEPVGGMAPYTYQWYYNTTAANTGGTAIAVNGNSASYDPILPQYNSSVYFWCRITDSRGVYVNSAVSGLHKATPATYAYKGSAESVSLPAGVYRLETWGASGGRGFYSTAVVANASFGGASSGHIKLESTKTLHIVVGGMGATSTNGGTAAVRNRISGGFNGGGLGAQTLTSGGTTAGRGGGGGGGATHISWNAGLLTDQAARDGIILVAGGGGGGTYSTGTTTYGGGRGGGVTGEHSNTTGPKGGTDIAGGAAGFVCTIAPGANMLVQATAGELGRGGDGAILPAGQTGGGGGGG